MLTEQEIKLHFTQLHDNLTIDYYENKLMSKEDFDYYHAQIWSLMETQLISDGYRNSPSPIRDLAKEIDDLKIKLKEKGIL